MCFPASVSPELAPSDVEAQQGRETHIRKQRLTLRPRRRVRRVTTSACAMDAIRIPKVYFTVQSNSAGKKTLIRALKVSNVLCSKSGRTLPGTLHLTAHHLIFSYEDDSQPEMWAS